MKKIRIAIIGMGLMGTRHARLLSNMDKFKLVGICDEDIKLEHNLNEFGVPFYNNVEKLISITKPDAVIIATPNETHLKILQICVTYKVDVLIEKPISDSIESSNKIIELSNSPDFNILIGHHRRYNNLIQKLRSIIVSGEIGNLVAVSVIWGLMKPKNYFFHKWRKNRPGGGPVLINLIHELDILRYICGEVENIHSNLSSNTREYDVEDSVAISIKFINGALATIIGSDTVVSPWSYESNTSENLMYYHIPENCYYFMGDLGSIGFPKMEIWKYIDNNFGWQHAIKKFTENVEIENPLIKQLEHFYDVINGICPPMVTATDATRSLSLALAVLGFDKDNIG
ncbi:MAG: Gfo/Idh/MocA family protein [Dehalococcoidia bacterium]